LADCHNQMMLIHLKNKSFLDAGSDVSNFVALWMERTTTTVPNLGFDRFNIFVVRVRLKMLINFPVTKRSLVRNAASRY
jgi:hypothetical protein